MFASSKNKVSPQKVKVSAPGTRSLSLLIDIESGLVRGALVLNTQGVAPHVLYTVSSKIATSSESKVLEAMTKSLKEVSADIAHKAIPEIRVRGIDLIISKVHCALSSPWAISKTKTVKVDYGEDVDITKDLVNKIVNIEHDELVKKFRLEHAGAGEEADADLSFIEQKIFEIKLNGYAVTHFQGKRAREVEVSFAVTASSKEILDAIHDGIGANLNIVSLRGVYGVKGEYVDEFHSSLLLQYSAFRSLINVRNDYIAAHVHNDLSDIIVVRRGVCSVLASFPFGAAAFIKKSAATLNQSDILTESALSINADQHLSTEGEKVLTDASDPVIREWAAQFFKTLSTVTDPGTLPKVLILSVYDHFPYFKKALSAEGPSAALDITALDEVLLEKAVSYERPQDTDALVTMYAFALDPAMHADFN